MAYDYDLFVIGAGSGGVRAANRSAMAGAKVAIAEESLVGGTCVVRGCVPKKLMMYASQYADHFREASGFGWTVGETGFDWPTLRDTIQTELGRLTGLYKKGLEGNDVTRFDARAVIKDAHTVHLVGENRDVSVDKILIATGGRPSRDHSADPDNLGITSDDVFHLPELPKSMIIAGGGYIAIEFAHIFQRMGTEVTLVYRGERLLRTFDRDISERVERDLVASGVRYINNTIFAAIREERGQRAVELMNGEVLHADQVLWAIGRRPHTEGLGANLAGVELDKQGAVIVNEHHQTSVENIFAVGDVTDRVNLTPVAIREGMAFAYTQFRNEPRTMSYEHIPMAVFSQPPVATCGPSEAECIEAGHEVDVYEADFRPMKATLAGTDERMFMKLIVDRETDKVLACHMVVADGPEIIQIVAVALKAGLTKAQFDETCAIHPTAAEELVTLSSKRAGRA